MTKHFPVMLNELLSYLPENGIYLDVTAGGGGHLCTVLREKPGLTAFAMDRDPRAIERVRLRLESEDFHSRVTLIESKFSIEPAGTKLFDIIFADLGVSTFQFTPELSGMSLKSENNADFRMNPGEGVNFETWLKACSIVDLEDIFFKYAEEPKAKTLARALKEVSFSKISKAVDLAAFIQGRLAYRDSKIHPATRIFQAFRIAINNELRELEDLLTWAPRRLTHGGRLLVISFHSLEDRIVKKAFVNLARSKDFDILSKKPLLPSDAEIELNRPSRSAKMRGLLKK